jgi:hypothetical protein
MCTSEVTLTETTETLHRKKRSISGQRARACVCVESPKIIWKQEVLGSTNCLLSFVVTRTAKKTKGFEGCDTDIKYSHKPPNRQTEGYTRQQGDLISLFLFFQNRKLV